MKSKNCKGFTLIEILSVMVILGLLITLLMPSFSNNAVKVRRVSAKVVLLELQSREEQYFINNKSYTDDFKNLGFLSSSDDLYIDSAGEKTSPEKAFYQLTVSIDSDFCGEDAQYCLSANPVNEQEKADADCAVLKVLSNGSKTSNGKNDVNCWTI